MTSLVGGTTISAAATATKTFGAVADAYVSSSKPNTNYGKASKLTLDASPVERAYIRFAVAGLAGTVSHATLRVYALNRSPAGVAVRAVADNAWGETTITYANAPAAASTPTSSSGSFLAGQWLSLDVTPLVAGDGTLSVALTTASTSQTAVASREAGASAPQLVVETIDNRPPVNTSPPAISGAAAENETLTASPGSWTGADPIAYAYQWRRCDAAGANCADIAGATADRYVLTTAEVGLTIRVVVTGSNSVGSNTAVSAQTGVVVAAVPPPPPPPDTTPPQTVIDSGPDPLTNATSAVFAFSSSEPNSTFDCALDGSAFHPCSSPASYSTLADGAHSFEVRAIDAAGNVDSTPALRTWTVDTIPPETTIDSGPDGSTTEASATFTFSSEAGASFGCSLDGAAYSACTSPKQYAALNPGAHTFRVRATDGAANTDVTPAERTWTVESPPPPPPSNDPVIAAAGDIASSGSGDEATAKLLDALAPTAVLTLGDNAYPDGAAADFASYYEPTWGRHKAITHPSAGNHEYTLAGATGYFGYFGAAAGDPAKGYYSFDLGGWHLVALNSNCSAIGGCGAGSPQEVWLRADLAASTAPCTLAYWHHPLFSSGNYRPGVSSVRPLFQALYDYGADVVLNGHDHNYERFAPQTPSGALDLARGIREFIVGTGGGSHYNQSAIANSEVRNSTTYGVLRLTLRAGGYDWEFLPQAGMTFRDAGSGSCSGTASDSVPPTAPTNLTANAPGSFRVDLTWGQATDNLGVVAHDVYRDGTLIATTSAMTNFTDNTVAAGTTYTYEVRARDAAGNVSPPSNTATVTTPAGALKLLTVAPAADAAVYESTPGMNYATASLRTDGGPDPDVESYVRFTVTGVTGTVRTATLRIYASSGTVDGPAAYTTGPAWDEGSITWNSRPPRGAVAYGDKAAIAGGTWVEYDVTPVISGDGTFSFALATTSSDGVDFYSRESGSFPPELVVTYD